MDISNVIVLDFSNSNRKRKKRYSKFRVVYDDSKKRVGGRSLDEG